MRSLPLFCWLKTAVRLIQLYLVFASSFFSAGLSIGAASLAGSLGVAGGAAGSAGAAGAAGGGGGGGAGSSFLPHPTNVSVKAKSIMADIETNFFPIIDSPPFPSLKSLPVKLLISHNRTGYSSGFGTLSAHRLSFFQSWQAGKTTAFFARQENSCGQLPKNFLARVRARRNEKTGAQAG
jgi:hypothetical protein